MLFPLYVKSLIVQKYSHQDFRALLRIGHNSSEVHYNCWANQVVQYTEILFWSDLDNLYLTTVPQENQKSNT